MLDFQWSPAYKGQNMTGTVEPSCDRSGFWGTLGNWGEAEGTAFCPWIFLKFGQSGGGSYIQQLCPGAQTRSSTRFLSAHLHGGTITAILPFCERRDGLSRKKDLSVAVFMMSVMNCTLQTRAVINWVCLTMMTNNIWREATKKQS